MTTTSRTATTRPTRTRKVRNAEPRWKNYLEAARRKQGKSQSEVAAHIDRKQNLISAIERGDRSGREYMDEIAEFLRVSDPALIFPYYNSYTFEEAAELMGVSSTLISRRVDEKTLDCEQIGGVRLIPKDALRGIELRKRPAKSMRARLREKLTDHPTGLTSRAMLADFGPFETEADEKRTFQSIQSILARFGEFERGGLDDAGLILWKLGE